MTKQQMLKLAGAKDEKSFYAKFPTEESFMAKYGGEFKKAQQGYTTPGFVQGFGMNPQGQYDNSFNSVQFPEYAPLATNLQQMGQNQFEPNPVPTYNNQFKPAPLQYGNGPISNGVFDRTTLPENVSGNKTDYLGKALPVVGGILGGLSALDAEKQQRKQAQQARRVSEITLQASATRPEQIARRYVRPEDNVFATNQFFPANGVGTNVLAKDGISLESYQGGGDMLSSFAENFGQNMYGNIVGGLFDNNGGSQIGGAIGSAFGPVGGVIGSVAGGMLDTNGRDTRKAQEATKRNLYNMMLNNAAPGIQAGYASHLRSGGNMRGSYTVPREEALGEYAMGGELQTHWGGETETISHNPYLPHNGETVMFRGQSHDESDGKGNSGIGITYGGSPVEVERGEPAVRLPDGSGDSNLTVFGNLKIPKEYIPLLGDESAKGKKFKNYVADLSKNEAKQNTLVNKSTDSINALDVITSFDKLKMASLEANVTGGNMKLKQIAERKVNAAALQDAINQTAEEKRLDADALAKGKMKKAVNGMEIPKAQNGTYKVKGQSEGKWSYTPAGETGNPLWDTPERYDQEWAPSVHKALADPERAKKMINYIQNYSGEGADNVHKAMNSKGNIQDQTGLLDVQGTNKQVGPMHYVLDAAMRATAPTSKAITPTIPEVATPQDNQYEVIENKRNPLVDVFNTVLPFIRPTDQEALDPNQLYGEMYALSNNQVDPVQAQIYQPDLGTPYDISYQDQLNANQSDYRSAQRLSGYNPAAQAMLNAQKYSANERVLGEQFRANQAEKDKVYGDNRNILNDAKVKNLGILDQQYVRQSQAVSNTKATAQAALNSISDKYAKNKLENRTLGVYENLYNYRYDAAGRAINMNPLAQFNTPYIYGPDGKITHVIVKDDKGNIIGYKSIDGTTDSKVPSFATPPYVPIEPKKNGGKITKNYSQGSIVKAFK